VRGRREISRTVHNSVMPAKAGIQYGVNSLEACSLDPGFRRGDEPIFDKPLKARCNGYAPE
jgi:hypothetical protein